MAEILVEAERSGVTMSFPQLVHGQTNKTQPEGLEAKAFGWGVFTLISQAALEIS